VRNKVLTFILIPVLFAWAFVLLVHRTEPSFYSNVVERIVCKVRISIEIVSFTSAVIAIRFRKNDFCFKLFNTYSKNVIRLLELSSIDDILAPKMVYSYNNDFAA